MAIVGPEPMSCVREGSSAPPSTHGLRWGEVPQGKVRMLCQRGKEIKQQPTRDNESNNALGD